MIKQELFKSFFFLHNTTLCLFIAIYLWKKANRQVLGSQHKIITLVFPYKHSLEAFGRVKEAMTHHLFLSRMNHTATP